MGGAVSKPFCDGTHSEIGFQAAEAAVAQEKKESNPGYSREATMLVPFGTHLVDREGKSVGTVSRLILHPQSQHVVAIVVQQGVIDRREIVVPVNRVESFRNEVRLTLGA